MGEVTSAGLSASKYWVGFNIVRGIGPMKFRALLDHFGDLETAWHADAHELKEAGLDQRALESLLTARANISLDREMEKVEHQGVRVLTWDDPAYPPRLLNIYNPPPVLYVKGEILNEDQWAVAVVGTRGATVYGKEAARQIAGDLARNRITIVSGLAVGIDADAHAAAVEAGGRTIAVLACGIDVDYPSHNLELRERIVGSGAVVTELAPGTPPTRDRFPQRNRILSGLALGTVVIEAPVKSGALITARLAAEEGREVFAVPGNITSPVSRGCHALLREGAALVETAEDVVEGLGIMLEAVPEREPEQERRRKLEDLPGDQQQVLDALSHQPRNIDDVTGECDLPASQVSAALMLLEVKGLVRRFPGNQFVRI